jgi:hypothetical protein
MGRFRIAGAKRARVASPVKGALFGAPTSRPRRCARKQPFVLGVMEQRIAALGFGWADVTTTQVYTIFDIHPFLTDQFVRRGAIAGGLTCIPRVRLCRASISSLMYAASPTSW